MTHILVSSLALPESLGVPVCSLLSAHTDYFAQQVTKHVFQLLRLALRLHWGKMALGAMLLLALFRLQVVQEMLEEVVSQLMSMQSQRANVPQHVLFPFVPARRAQQLPSPVRAKL